MESRYTIIYTSRMERAKLFRNGQSQAVRLPKKLRFEGTEVYARGLGGAVILLPVADPWGPLRQSLDLFTDDCLEQRPEQLGQKR